MGRSAEPQISFADPEPSQQGIFPDPLLQTISDFPEQHAEMVGQVQADLQHGLKNPLPVPRLTHSSRSCIAGFDASQKLGSARTERTRISVPFRGRRMKRCPAQERAHFELLIGAAVLANNLLRLADQLRKALSHKKKPA